uniref:Uncharacterized protein n=1 Tax=Avena sativa TaxID=4498 RepID=A0ACD6AE92_AVESA
MRAKLIFLFWRVWHHMNNIVHGDGKASVSASVPYLVNYLNSFNFVADPKADNKGKTPLLPDNAIVHPDSSGPSSWVAPRFGDVNGNVDAGWDALSRKAEIDVIIRDHEGTVILSEWKPIHSCMCAEEAEIHAVIVGLKHLIHLNCWPTIIESDCLRVVQALSSQEANRSGFWCLYEEARELLKIFTQISVVKVPRSSNLAAHSLAQLGKSGASGILCGATPSCVSDTVVHDCNV